MMSRPYCQSIWTIEEMEEERCACCGYTDQDEDDFMNQNDEEE